jgi:hypothetical protein
MTYAMSVIRRNLVNAATPPTLPINPSGTANCKLPVNTEPSSTQPIIKAFLSGGSSTANCDVTGQPVCNEVAFYQNISATQQQLVVFCVYNNILYEDVTSNGGLTTSYPVADNISGIGF